MKFQFFALLLVGVCVSGLSGCGSESDASAPTETVSTKTSETGPDKTAAATETPAETKPPKPTWPGGDQSDVFRKMVTAYENQEFDEYTELSESMHAAGAEVIEIYRYAITNGDAAQRKHACLELNQMGPDAAPATEELTTLLADEDVLIRSSAASVLSVVTEPPESLVPALVGLLETEWGDTAVTALGNLGAVAEPAIGAMVGKLAGAEVETQKLLLGSFERIGLAAQTALPEIKKLTSSDNAEVKAAAEQAVATIEQAVKVDEDVKKGESIGAGSDVPEKAAGPPPEAPALVNPTKDLEIESSTEAPDVKAPDASEIPDLPDSDAAENAEAAKEKTEDAAEKKGD